jgi:hypothetical protein
MTAFDRVREALDHQHVRYALIGAAALAARGIARSTFDIDLLTTDRRVLEATAWTNFSQTAIDIRRGDLDDPLAGVIRITLDADRPVDVVVGKQAWQGRAVERAEVVDGGAPIVLARDLVLLKLYAGGTQDLWDVRELLRLRGPELADEVTSDLAQLPESLQRMWKQV